MMRTPTSPLEGTLAPYSYLGTATSYCTLPARSIPDEWAIDISVKLEGRKGGAVDDPVERQLLRRLYDLIRAEGRAGGDTELVEALQVDQTAALIALRLWRESKRELDRSVAFPTPVLARYVVTPNRVDDDVRPIVHGGEDAYE